MVTPADGRAFDAGVLSEVNTLAIAQCVPGTSVSVTIDRTDPRKLWIDWLAVAGSAGTPT
ncbi:MAG: hypothetical protein ACRD2C_27840 [Acidimicrobiales bacterium]